MERKFPRIFLMTNHTKLSKKKCISKWITSTAQQTLNFNQIIHLLLQQVQDIQSLPHSRVLSISLSDLVDSTYTYLLSILVAGYNV